MSRLENGSSSSKQIGFAARARGRARRAAAGRRRARADRCRRRPQGRPATSISAIRARALADGRRPRPNPTLPATLRCGNSAKSWNTIPMRRSSGGNDAVGLETTRPDSAMLPPAMGSKPARQRSTVVLPQPEGPSRQPIRPSASVKSRPRTTRFAPYACSRLRTSTEAATARSLPCVHVI